MVLLKQRCLSTVPLIMLMVAVATNYLQWWYISSYCRRADHLGAGGLDIKIVCSVELCDCQSNNDAVAVEAALFDGADRCNDVCCGDKLIAWTMET